MKEEQQETREGSVEVAIPNDWPLHSDSIAGVAGALSKLQGELPLIKQTGYNPHFKNKFCEVREIVRATYPLLSKYGLALTQLTKPHKGTLWLVTVLMHEKTGEWLKGYWPMVPERKGQQALGSEHTYARRRGLESILALGTGDNDDDGEITEGRSNFTAADSLIQRLEELIGDHEESVNNFLINNNVIKQKQTFRDVDEKTAAEIVKRPSDLIAKATNGS
jgi:hypothetical protein